MKVHLVAVERPDGRRWHVSLDPALRADALHLCERDPSARLWRSVRPLPLGRALAAADKLNGKTGRSRGGFSFRACPCSSGSECGCSPGWKFSFGRMFSQRFSFGRMVPFWERGEAEPLLVPSGGGLRAGRAVRDHALDKLAEAMEGRSLLAEEFESLVRSLGLCEADGDWRFWAQSGLLRGLFDLRTAVAVGRPLGRFGRKRAVCRRCGADERWMRRTPCASCGEHCPYCERCLTMGRARACTPLIVGLARRPARGAEPFGPASREERGLSDAVSAAMAAVPGLALSPAQEAAAREGVRFVLSGKPGAPGAAVRPFLIWAVTGAGKTEMMFPLIAAERARGGRVAVATPRRDVVLELLPRIAAAFPDEKTAALYGGTGRSWPSGGILVATTHQMLRFEAAFDLVVLDEVDAFPYHGDPMLAFAARKACKPGAAFVMLSATPPLRMQRAVRRGRLACAKVPVRYHRRPLPVPSYARPAQLAALLAQSLERGAQAFVFVPRIARLEPELARLRQALAGVCPPGRLEATSSRDPKREEKVRRLRAGDIRILLTTTILERGVTIPKADVYILDADHRLFDAAALVQMAGRAGRSAADPAGRVVFLSRRRTREQRRAIRQIRAMNRLAGKMGWLEETPPPGGLGAKVGRGRAPCRE